MTYKTGHQEARRGPWTVSLLGALEGVALPSLISGFPPPELQEDTFVLKFVAMCYSSPWKLRQPVPRNCDLE